MAASFILTEAANADGCAQGDLGEELDGLAAGGVREQLAFVPVEELFALRGFIGTEGANLGDELGVGRECWQPDIEVAVGDPSVFGHAARRMACDADAEALLGPGGCADLKGGEMEFVRHVSLVEHAVMIG